MKLRDQSCETSDCAMTWDDKFHFRCHPGIDCYNTCCRDVTIFLHPLDVIRLSRGLGMSTTDFLEQYTHQVISPVSGVPAVVLKMREDEGKTCPFVGIEGCSVYETRPYSCRLYPLDTEQGVEYKFIVDEGTCHGLKEPEEVTVEQWRREQGLHPYDELDHQLKDVMRADEVLEAKIEHADMQSMLLMALYDSDRFREFVFQSSFLGRFVVDEDILERIRNDDVALLYFAAQWLRFILFNQKGFLKFDRDYLAKKMREVLDQKRQEG